MLISNGKVKLQQKKEIKPEKNKIIVEGIMVRVIACKFY
jgi:hypothetical protein